MIPTNPEIPLIGDPDPPIEPADPIEHEPLPEPIDPDPLQPETPEVPPVPM